MCDCSAYELSSQDNWPDDRELPNNAHTPDCTRSQTVGMKRVKRDFNQNEKYQSGSMTKRAKIEFEFSFF